MNRAELRKLTKGDKVQAFKNLKEKDNEYNRVLANIGEKQRQIQNTDILLKTRLASLDGEVLNRGKEIASLIMEREYLPILRDVLMIDLKIDEARLEIFESFLRKRLDRRLGEIAQKADIKETEAIPVVTETEEAPAVAESTIVEFPTIEEVPEDKPKKKRVKKQEE